MISLFIFRSNARGMQYGIGTYINELTESLSKTAGIKIFIVSYHNSDCKELTVKAKTGRITEINIPSPSFHTSNRNSSESKYASSVVRLLSPFIPPAGNVVFQMNYIDDLSIAIKLKENYRHPIISIVHFAQWQQLFDGNKKKLNGLNIDKPSNNIEFTLSKEKEFYQVSDHIVSVTRYMKDFIVNDYGIETDKITVIPNGLKNERLKSISKEDRNSLKEIFGFGIGEIIILFSGRIDPCKGIFFLFDAFEEACRQNRNLRLVLMGQGNIQDCQRRLKSSFGKVTYTGFMSKELVTSFYKVADIGIVPSVYDHCPYTVLEMMANKIPLIVSRINGLDEILNDNQCRFVNPVINSEGEISFNINELSDAILKMAGDSNLRNELAKKSYERMMERFTANRMADQMNNLFKTVYKDINTP